MRIGKFGKRLVNNSIVKPRPVKEVVQTFINRATISGTIWRSHEVAALAGLKLYRPILDLGCGNGTFAKTIFSGKIDYGLDVSRDEIAKARRNKAYKNYIVSDAHVIPLADKSIQTVFSNSTFEHIPGLEGVLAEVSRILMPRGELIFTTHSPASKDFYGVKILRKLELGILAKIYERVFSNMLQLETTWSLKTWKRNLLNAGLKVEETKTMVSPRIAFWFEFFLPFTYFQNRLPFLKKIRITKLVLLIIRPNYYESSRNGRNFFIRAKKI